MSKTLRAIAGVALIVVGAVTGNIQLIIAGAALTAGALTKTRGTSRQAQVSTLSIGEQPREAIFGEAVTSGSLLTGFNYGGTYGTDWEVLAVALADHQCDALVGFYVNDAFVTFGGNGAVAGYNGQLRVTWHNGAADQATDATLTSRGGWAATDRLAGVAYVVVEYKADAADAKNPVWPGGRPRFSWRVRGKRCYDPRKDSTLAGGSGPQRWADPSTWTWTDNLAVCRYNWVRGVYACDRVGDATQLLVGRGLSAAEAPPERLAAAANLCDEIVDGEPRYRCAAVIAADEVFADVEAKFAVACAGITIQPDGGVELEPGQAKPIVAFITDADLVVGKPIVFSDYRSEADEEWCNTVVAQYIEPTQKWAQHSAPVMRDPADVLADKGPRERPLTLDYVTWVKQAQRVAEITRRLGRLPRTATITLGPRFAELEEGDWIACRLRRTKNQDVYLRIEAFSSDETRQMTLTLREIAPSVFGAAPTFTDRAAATQQAAPPSAAFDGRSTRLVEAGDWAGATTYQAGDLVQYQGSTWLYVAATAEAGHVPPALPTTSDAWWRLFARAGATGPRGEDGFANLLDLSGWVPGATGSIGGFVANGDPDENSIQLLPGPIGASEPVWYCVSRDAAHQSGRLDGDGGWDHDIGRDRFDPQLSYRFMVWANQDGAASGNVYLGTLPGGVVALDTGQVDGNPYFWVGGLPQRNRWYLIVGIVHGAGYTGGQSGISGVYDPATGQRVLPGADYRFLATATSLRHRAYQYYSESGSVVGLARPSVEEIGQTTYTVEQLFGTVGMTAAQAQAFQQAQDRIVAISSDSVLSAGSEKQQAVLDWAALYNEVSALNDRYQALGAPGDITAARDAAIAARAALEAYLGGLAPAWSDVAQDTPIIAATWQSKWGDAYQKLGTLRAAITGRKGDPGAAGVVGYLTNEAAQVAANSYGVVTSYAGAAFSVRVLAGGQDVTGQFSLSVIGNPQSLSIGGAYPDYQVTDGFDASEDVANVTVRLTGGGAYAGVAIDRVFTLSKTRTGADGVNPAIITINASSQVARYDTNGTLVTGSITFTAARKNVGGAQTYWEVRNLDGTTADWGPAPSSSFVGNLFSAPDGDTLVMNAAGVDAFMGGREGFVIRVYPLGLPSTFDTITVYKSRDGTKGADGKDGFAVDTETTNFVQPTYSSGASKPGWAGGTGTIRLNKGGARITAGVTYEVANSNTSPVAGLSLAGDAFSFSGAMGQKGEFVIRAIYAGVAYEKVVAVKKVADGEAAFSGTAVISGDTNAETIADTPVPAGRTCVISAAISYFITQSAAGNYRATIYLYWRNVTDNGGWNLIGQSDGSYATVTNNGSSAEPDWVFVDGAASCAASFTAPSPDKQIAYRALVQRTAGGRPASISGSVKLEVRS